MDAQAQIEWCAKNHATVYWSHDGYVSVSVHGNIVSRLTLAEAIEVIEFLRKSK